MCVIKITKHQFAHTFGGVGFHNNDATMYHIVENEHCNLIGNNYLYADYPSAFPYVLSTVGFPKSDSDSVIQEKLFNYERKLYSLFVITVLFCSIVVT